MDSKDPVQTGGAGAVVAKCCQLVLGIKSVRLEDDFYKLGGTSLSLIRVITLLMDTGYDVNIEDLPVGPGLTIRHLASAVTANGGGPY